jgi:hypothetical protein
MQSGKEIPFRVTQEEYELLDGALMLFIDHKDREFAEAKGGFDDPSVRNLYQQTQMAYVILDHIRLYYAGRWPSPVRLEQAYMRGVRLALRYVSQIEPRFLDLRDKVDTAIGSSQDASSWFLLIVTEDR